MNFNISPYNDAFDINKKYYSILFKPGYMVQARELNELQSQMQNQVASLGNHLFKNDAKISGGSCSFIQYDRIKLTTGVPSGSSKITSLNGLTANIVYVIDNELFVVYKSTANDNETTSFITGDFLLVDDIEYEVEEVSKSLLFIVKEGIFYHDGMFLYTDEQIKVVEKYLVKDNSGFIVSDKTYSMCLDVVEQIIDSTDDKSLLDPHSTYNNFGAPGADRYKVDLVLSQRPFYDDGSRHIVLAKVKQNASIDYLKTDTEYAEIMKMLAQRLYETYGDFCVKEWTSSYYNELKKNESDTRGWVLNGSDDHYVAVVQPGIGYIKGYRIETLTPVVIRAEKPRDTITISKSFEPNGNIITFRVTSNDIFYLNENESPDYFDLPLEIETILYKTGDEVGTSKTAYKVSYIGNKTYQVYYNESINETYNTIAIGQLTGNIISKSVKTPLIDTKTLYTKSANGFSGTTSTITSVLLDNNGNGTLTLPTGYKSVLVYNDGIEAQYTIEEDILTLELGEEGADVRVDVYITLYNNDFQIGTKTLKTINKSYESKPISDTSKQYLDHVDCVSLEKVVLTDEEGRILSDITNEYTFHDGDTSTSYGFGSISRKAPRVFKDSDRIVVTYKYFEHTIPGIFTASSYVSLSLIKSVEGKSLANYIDLRLPNTELELINDVAIEYYLPRIDALLVNSTGEIYIKQGNSSERPSRPPIDDDSMLLYEINLNPFCNDIVSDTRPNYIDNKVRLTKDINNISTRVDKLEEAVALSMLEQQTVDMTILDSTGKSRYKNGFIVDNFKTFNSADINNQEFKAGIDRNKGILRPSFSQDNVRLEFDENDSNNFYQIGNVVCPKYEHDLFISNIFATRTISVNPYLTFRKNGVVALSPNIDTWADDTILPEVNKSVDMSPNFNNVTVDSGSIDYGSWVNYNTSIASTGKVNDTKMTQYSIDDIVKDVTITPYVRSRTVEIYAANLKPNTKIYAYFDGVNVTEHCKLTKQIAANAGVITSRSAAVYGGTSLVTDENGTLSAEFRIPKNTFFTGEKTFVLTNDPNNTGDDAVETTRATCSYFAGGVSQTKQTENLNIVTPIYNNTGDLKNNSTYFSRDVTTAQKTFVATDNMTCEDLVTYVLNHNINEVYFDSLSGVFVVPGYGAGSFDLNSVSAAIEQSVEKEIQRRIGLIKSFRQKQLEDDLLRVNTACANGVSPKKEYDSLKLRNDRFDEISKTWNKGNLSWTGYTRDVIKTIASNNIAARIAAARDPIAQGFKVDNDCFISKVGIYFSEIDKNSDVIWFEIRELKNGYPVEESITHKEVLSKNLVDFVSDDATKEYQVEFDVPVYIDSTRSYCFVIGGYTPDTRVYISTLGEKLISNGEYLEQPPLPYTMFRSLNGETWNAQQFDTLKMNIYRCVFNTNPLVVSLKSEANKSYNLNCANNPFELQPNSTRVRVYANNHNLKVNDRVSIDVNSETYYRIEVTSGMPQVGQPFSTLTGQGYVKDIKITNTLNVYEVSLNRVVGVFKPGQEFTCEIRKVLYRDLVTAEKFNIPTIPIVQNQANGHIQNSVGDIINDISGADISLFSKEHIIKEIDSCDSFVIEVDSPFSVVGRFGGDKVVLHDKNIKFDVVNVSGQYLSYSAKEKMTISGYDSNNVKIQDVLIKHACDVDMDQPMFVLSSNNEKRILGADNRSLEVSLEIQTNNVYVGPMINVDSFSATLVTNRIESINLESYKSLPIGEDRYIPETHHSDGVEKCKYVTNKVLLDNPANDLKVLLSAHCPSGCTFDIYVKLYRIESGNGGNTEWTKLLNTITYTSIDRSDMVEYSLSLEKNMTGWTTAFAFTGYRVKIVMNSNNSTRYPVIKDLRAIAVT